MTRVRLIAFFCAVVLLSTMAAPARSAPRAGTGNFATLAPASLTPAAHPLGCGTVSKAGDRLTLGPPAGTSVLPMR